MTKNGTEPKLENLAIFGGKPLFSRTLHVGSPNLGDRSRFIERIHAIFNANWLSNNGPYVQEFENKIQSYTGAKHCISTVNGTMALQLAIKALNLSGKVIVPSFTFIATAHALKWEGIEPVFCDISADSHNIDPHRIEKLIRQDVTAILATHVWGKPCEIDPITEIASKWNLKLLFDAAHAFSCSYKGKMIGNFGDAEIFSFHATKFFNSFEGGAVMTNDDHLAEKLRLMRNFGFQGLDNVANLGINGKMNEACAAMGLTSFEKMDHFIAHNKKNYLRYMKKLEGLNPVKLFEYDLSEKNNFQYIALELDEEEAGLNRDLLIKILHKENIRARRYFYPGCHQMNPYNTQKTSDPLLFTKGLSTRIFLLPTGVQIAEEEIDKISMLLKFVVANGEEIFHFYKERKHGAS